MDLLSLVARLSLDTSEYDSGISKAASSMRNLKAELEKMSSSASSASSGIDKFGNSNTTASGNVDKLKSATDKLESQVKDIGSSSKSAADGVDDIGDSSKSAKTGVEGLGSSSEKAKTGVKGLGDSSKESSDKSEGLRTALERLTSEINSQESELSQLKTQYQNYVLEGKESSTEAEELKQKINSLNSELNENKSALKSSEDATEGLTREVDDLGEASQETATQTQSLGDIIKGSFLGQALYDAFSKITDGVIEFGKSTVETGMEFDTAMSQVAATLGTTTDNITNVRDAAQEMGATTAFTATEAAQGLNTLAMAGLDADEAITALPQVLSLASAGAMSLDNAASYVTGTIKGFGDTVDNAQKYVDLMAKGATLANTDVNGLGAALSDASASAKTYGQSAESVTLSLLRLAEQNVTGEEAATALSRAMMDLYTPTDKAKSALDALGVSVYDVSTGAARDFNDVVADLSAALSGMSDEEKLAYENTIFTTYGMDAFNKMTATSSDKVNEFKDGLASASTDFEGMGAAAGQAATQLDNLQGDVTLADSALDGLKVAVYDAFSDDARNIVQGFTDKITGLTESIQNGDLQSKLSLIASAVTGLATALITFKAAAAISGVIEAAVTSFNSFKAANEGATIAQWALNAAMNANPFVLIASLIAGVVAAIVVLWNTNEDFRNNVTQAWENIKETFSAAITAIGQTLSDLKQKISDIWNGIKTTVSDVLSSIKDNISQAWDNVKTTISSTLDSIKTTVSNVWDNIKSKISDALNSIKNTVSDGWNNIKTKISDTLTEIKAKISEIWENIKTNISDALNNIKEKVSSDWDSIKSSITDKLNSINKTVSDIWSKVKTTVSDAMNSIKEKVSSIFSSISTTVSGALSGISNTFSSTWNSIKTTVSGAVDNVRNKISDGLSSAKGTVSNVLDGIGSKFSSVWENAKKTVSGAIDKIKSVMNFSWSLPKLKLPHISISGSFSLNPPSVPHFGINWYKKAMDNAMLLDSATIFGAAGGKLLGAGEAGREVVAGADTLMNMMKSAIKDVSGEKENQPVVINITINGAKYSDENQLVQRISRELQNLSNRKAAVYAR